MIHVSGINRFYYHKVEIHGDNGSVKYHDMDGKPEMQISGFDASVESLPSEFPSVASYRNELRQFIECVTERKKPLTDSRVGRYSLELVLKDLRIFEEK